MASPFSYKNDSDEDLRASPEETAKRAAQQLQEQEQQSGYDRDFDALTNPEHLAKDGKPGDVNNTVRDAEEAPASPTGGWGNNFTGSSDKKGIQSRAKVVLNFVKKRGAIFGISGLLAGGGIGLLAVGGPASMLIATATGGINQNDSSSTAERARIMKSIGFSTGANADCSGSKIRCKESKISNKALSELKAKGVTPIFDDNSTVTTTKGYPDKNPKLYQFNDDGKTSNVLAGDLEGFLAKNPKMAAMAIGTGGAFNPNTLAWKGKALAKKFLDPFNLKRDGGIADGENKKTSSSSERLQNALDKIKLKIPSPDTAALSDLQGKLQEKTAKQLGKSKKGGAAYTALVASCLALKAPGLVAGGVAAVQLLQVLPYANDIILSPADKLKASGVDKSAKFTSEDMDTIGTVLTEKSPRASDGKEASALDSPILQSAIGVNTGKPAISKEFTPGYGVYSLPAIIEARKAAKATEPECNALMSPAAMYTAFAVDSAATVVASGTLVGGIIKVGVGFVIQTVATQIAVHAISGFAKDAFITVAKNDAIPKAKGEDLGDILGISMLTYFSGGGMAHNLPGLKESQLSSSLAVQKQTQDFQKQMDVASLSPFDTSSQYTFLGSLINKFGMASITSGASSGSIFTNLLAYMKAPLTSLTTSANATNFTPESCGYATDFGLEADAAHPNDTPAINAAGMPCTGLTAEQAGMSSDTALALIEQEHWLNEDIDIPDGATIQDLVDKQYIKPNTPLSDFIESCSDATSGDYLYNAAACTVDSTTGDLKTVNDAAKNSAGCADNACTGSKQDYGDNDETTADGVSDARALAAISVFLLDFQIHQSINGEDDETGADTTAASTTADATIDQDHIYDDSTSVACAAGTTDAGTNQGYRNGTEIDIRLCSIPGTSDNGPDGNGNPLRVNSRVSGAVLGLVNAFKASPANTNGDPMKVADSFRTNATQASVYAQYGSPRAAPAGYSNHQMGLAIDFQLGNNSGASRPGDPAYDWLTANAGTYGFTQLATEAWHWQPLKADGSKT